MYDDLIVFVLGAVTGGMVVLLVAMFVGLLRVAGWWVAGGRRR